MTARADPHERGRSLTTVALLVLLVSCFFLFAALAVPRLTNYAVGDIEFTGWSSPFAARIARGERPYIDFILPIPPGSLGVLAIVAKLAGRSLLLHELWLNALSALGMTIAAYAIARALTTRTNAMLTAFGTLVILLRSGKECGYDHSAQLIAWISIAVGVHALTTRDARTRLRLFVVTGALAVFTVAFKQSTALGITFGWLTGLGYIGLVDFVSRDRPRLRDRARELCAFAIGGAIGALLTLAVILAVRSTPGAFYQAVFADGPSLKGGSISLTSNLVNYLVGTTFYPAGLVTTVLSAAVLVKVARSAEGFQLGSSAGESTAISRATAWWIAALTAAVFGTAALLLATRVSAIPESLLYFTDRLRLIPTFGLFLGCFFFVGQLVRVPSDDPTRAHAVAAGHAMNAVAIAALSTALFHNLSTPDFRPIYDDNPVVPLAFIYLFSALDRANLPRIKLALFALSLAALFSFKLDRALAANLPVGREGHWAKLRIGESALPIVNAIIRTRELAAPNETVLVLPEDLELASLVDRPRPPIKGAVVFVDQYAARLAPDDIATLDKNPPKVVIIRPNDRDLWERMFALWNAHGGAAQVVDHFLNDLLPHRYRLDSSYPTRWGDRMVDLQVWVRVD